MREFQRGLDEGERRFLLPLVAGAPECPLLGITFCPGFSGHRITLHNCRRANARKFAAQAEALASRLAFCHDRVAGAAFGIGLSVDVLYFLKRRT